MGSLSDVSDILLPRIPVIELFPVIENGRLAAKATQNEPLPIRATVFREGHDAFAAEAVLIAPDGTEFSRTPMVDIAPGLDRYEAWVMPNEPRFPLDFRHPDGRVFRHVKDLRSGDGVSRG